MLPREASVKSWRRAVGERRDIFRLCYLGDGWWSMVVVDDELEGLNWLWYEVMIWVSFVSVVIEIKGLCELRR
jgi:hypothetical protein